MLVLILLNVRYFLILESLSKQKKIININPHRGKSSNATSTLGKNSKFGSSLQKYGNMNKENMKLIGIFANPPNPTLKPKSY